MDHIVIRLFFKFLEIGFFSIGGGYAIIPIIQDQVVNTLGWLSIQEYTDIITISQMTPGPLVVNVASFVGIRIGGVPGAFMASLGSVLSGFFISILLFNFFKKYKNAASIANVLKGLRASSIGLIASAASTILLLAFFNTQTLAALDIENLNLDYIAVAIFGVSLFFLRKYKLNPILLIILTGVLGLFIYY